MAKIAGIAGVFIAMTVVGTPAVNALQFQAGEYPAQITGTQSEPLKLSVGGGTVSCKSVTESGEMSEASEELRMIPVYKECTAFGFVGAEVTGFGANKCAWTYGAGGWTALSCVSGNDIKIDAGTCSVTLQSANNQGLTSINWTNTPLQVQIIPHRIVTGIHAVVTSGILCPIAAGTYTNATYTGSSFLVAKKNGVTVSIELT